MPKYAKHSKGRLTVHLTELIEYANNFRNAEKPLMAMMQRLLIDFNAYAGVDEHGKLNVSQRLVEPLKDEDEAQASP